MPKFDREVYCKGAFLIIDADVGGSTPPSRPSPSPVRYGETPRPLALPDLQPLSDRLDDLAKRIEALRRR